ncbi:MAG: transglutaminase-like domain-containing protein [Candidatus Electrothrix sp. YB6]
MPVRILKILTVCCWLALLFLLVQQDFLVPTLQDEERAALIRAKYEQYYGVHLYDRRIGYVLEDFRPREDGGYRVRQKSSLRLKVLNSVQPVSMELNAQLDSSLRLQIFAFTFSSPFYSTTAEGRVQGNTVHFTLQTSGTTISDAVTLQTPPLLPLHQRGYLLNKLPEKGDKLKIPFFDPLTLADQESVITYKGKNKRLISGRVHKLHHFMQSYAGMQINFWLDDEGKVIKEKSPTGFVFLAEPKFKAMNIRDGGEELLSAVAVQYSGELLPEKTEVARYHLQFPEEAEVNLEGGRQQVVDGGGNGSTVLLAQETFPPLSESDPPDDSGIKGENSCAADETALRPSRYVQADDPYIVEKAKEIVGATADPANQAALLAKWVYQNIEKRPVIGLPDARSTLESGRGDCNEHAALFAALARSLQIPTVIAAGVTLQNNAFYYHAWNEICINGQWISLDTTVNQLPADLYHIRFTHGDLRGQLSIGGLIGKLQIEILQPEE